MKLIKPYTEILTYAQGEILDKESGELHLSHALTNIMFLIWKIKANENESN